jgi:hypothetical protein
VPGRGSSSVRPSRAKSSPDPFVLIMRLVVIIHLAVIMQLVVIIHLVVIMQLWRRVLW